MRREPARTLFPMLLANPNPWGINEPAEWRVLEALRSDDVDEAPKELVLTAVGSWLDRHDLIAMIPDAACSLPDISDIVEADQRQTREILEAANPDGPLWGIITDEMRSRITLIAATQ